MLASNPFFVSFIPDTAGTSAAGMGTFGFVSRASFSHATIREIAINRRMDGAAFITAGYHPYPKQPTCPYGVKPAFIPDRRRA
jgi:hypothetical protein